MSEAIRINKFISEAGVCSRRKADELILEGHITIDGEVAVAGSKVYENSIVKYKNKVIRRNTNHVIYAYNKPVGQVCTSKEADKNSIFAFVDFKEPVNYVGRLDKDSQGLLLLTNDGDLSNSIQKSKNGHEKEYLVRVNKDITDDFIEKMSNGVSILDVVTKKCKVEKTGARSFRIILTQGLNRQIRRMCEALDYRVVHLKRVRVMNIKLGDLRPGAFRCLTKQEEQELRKRVEGNNER